MIPAKDLGSIAPAPFVTLPKAESPLFRGTFSTEKDRASLANTDIASVSFAGMRLNATSFDAWTERGAKMMSGSSSATRKHA